MYNPKSVENAFIFIGFIIFVLYMAMTWYAAKLNCESLGIS